MRRERCCPLVWEADREVYLGLLRQMGMAQVVGRSGGMTCPRGKVRKSPLFLLCVRIRERSPPEKKTLLYLMSIAIDKMYIRPRGWVNLPGPVSPPRQGSGWRASVDIAVAFGRAVKLRRTELGINQEELAYRSGLVRSFISGVERGGTNPSMESIQKIADALDCHVSDLWLAAERIQAAQRDTPGSP